MGEPEKNLLLKEKDFLKWKRAYKDCKKYRSVAIKDSYDEFVSQLKDDYRTHVKGASIIGFEDLTNFFNLVSSRADEYLKRDKKEKSKFYFDKREKAVKNLKEESEKMNVILHNKQLEIEDNKKKDQEGFRRQVGNIVADFVAEKFGANISIDSSIVNIDSGIENCAYAIVADVPYMKFKFTTFRIYIVLVGRSSGAYRLEKFFGKFSFKEYNLINKDNQTIPNYRDKDFKSRKIYKACEIPIDVKTMPLVRNILGDIDLKVKIYVSPNDFISKTAFKYCNINVNKVKLEKTLLTEAEI